MNLPFHFMVHLVASWVNRHQQAVIDYLSEERQILIKQLGGKPKAFSDSQRIRLAQRAKKLGQRESTCTALEMGIPRSLSFSESPVSNYIVLDFLELKGNGLSVSKFIVLSLYCQKNQPTSASH